MTSETPSQSAAGSTPTQENQVIGGAEPDSAGPPRPTSSATRRRLREGWVPPEGWTPDDTDFNMVKAGAFATFFLLAASIATTALVNHFIDDSSNHEKVDTIGQTSRTTTTMNPQDMIIQDGGFSTSGEPSGDSTGPENGAPGASAPPSSSVKAHSSKALQAPRLASPTSPTPPQPTTTAAATSPEPYQVVAPGVQPAPGRLEAVLAVFRDPTSKAEAFATGKVTVEQQTYAVKEVTGDHSNETITAAANTVLVVHGGTLNTCSVSALGPNVFILFLEGNSRNGLIIDGQHDTRVLFYGGTSVNQLAEYAVQVNGGDRLLVNGTVFISNTEVMQAVNLGALYFRNSTLASAQGPLSLGPGVQLTGASNTIKNPERISPYPSTFGARYLVTPDSFEPTPRPLAPVLSPR